MDDPIGLQDGKVDVTRVMEALRERIRRRREDLPVEQVVALRLQALADEAELGSDLLGPLLRGERGWNVNANYRIVTHRKGLGAFLVVTLKRLVRPFIRLYTDPLVERQAQINLYLLRVVEALLAETTRLQQAVAAAQRGAERSGKVAPSGS
jgi:hypothetical protein